MNLIDAEARRRALTELNETLLVEAAAGTGKTALMAGRAALLLASGVLPGSIAAITFTELAAGELSLRIRSIVEALRIGEVPVVLRPALPAGLSAEQAVKIEAAAGRLDEMTATTIHGFCQDLIRAYAVEADLDPGAMVMDAAQADTMFEDAFASWLRRRLSGGAEEGGPIGVLAADDPLGIVATLHQLARVRRDRPSAQPPAVDLSLRPDLDFLDAVDAFERWFASGPAEARTADLLSELRGLAEFYRDSLTGNPAFEELWHLARPPRTSFMKRRGLDWRAYALKGAWHSAAGDDGRVRFEHAQARYDACHTAFAALIGQISGILIAEIAASLDDLLEDYATQKRAAAALDFDDLLLQARSLLRRHDTVRRELGARYRHILVDEFQDTDPVQAEIIFALAADELPANWIEAVPRPGSLFLVGDPKQAIYRFRGAHVAVYSAVRDAMEARSPESIVHITANFRSAPQILDHVNSVFAAPLSQRYQPGYVPLSATRDQVGGVMPAVAKLEVNLPPHTSAPQQRDAEAEVVADLCRRLIGTIEVVRADGMSSALRAGDIALLAPTGTELWRYERALERVGLSVASQAGKALMRRQETQDLLALLRALADPLDTLAFGALMRGPLVGLTEARLLAITTGLPADEDAIQGLNDELDEADDLHIEAEDSPEAADKQKGPRVAFTLRTSPHHVADPQARAVLETLQALRRLAATATPATLLAEAIERLNIRTALALRASNRGGREIANLDALIALAKPYRVRGLAAFVADLSVDWKFARPLPEGRIDGDDDAVSLVTIHSAKGLEWPVIIPINTATLLRSPEQFVHRQSDDTLHWVIGELTPPHLADAQDQEAISAARERERLWYVAVTRARELLILPELTGADANSWSRIVDLGFSRLPALDPAGLRAARPTRPEAATNLQSPEVFAVEAQVVAAAAPPITWRRPSEHDADRLPAKELSVLEIGEGLLEAPRPLGAGRVRGVLLHKLLEELLTGELPHDLGAVELRVVELVAQLATLEPEEAERPEPKECAATVLRARSLPGLADLWSQLEPEVTIYVSDPDGVLVAGRADAVAVVDGRPVAVLDWKSDLDPTPAAQASYLSQLAQYVRAIGAPRGAIVYLSTGEVVWTDCNA